MAEIITVIMHGQISDIGAYVSVDYTQVNDRLCNFNIN